MPNKHCLRLTVICCLWLGCVDVFSQESVAPLRRFVSGSRLTLGTQSNLTSSVRIADLDGDLDLDLVVANGRHWPQQNFLFLNQARGRFNVQRPLGIDWMTTYATEVADLDGDGDLDIAVGNDMAPNQVFLNDGKGHFQQGSDFGSISSVRSLTLADMNSDGHIDIVSTCRGRPNEIFLNRGDATFSEGQAFGAKDDSTIDVAVGDLNQDGHPDLVLANRDGQQNVILLNDGKLGFQKRIPYGTGKDQTRAVEVADLNGDGHLDLITANIGQSNAVYLGNGGGDFGKGLDFGRVDGQSYALAVGDMNNDGLLDLVVGNSTQENAVWFLVVGKDASDLRFVESRFGDPTAATYGLALGDLNGDGFKDIVTANSGAPNLIFLNQPVRK